MSMKKKSKLLINKDNFSKKGANVNESTKIKGIIFDLDNTLYDYMPAHLAGIKASQKIYPIPYNSSKYAQKYEVARATNEKLLFGVASSHNRLLYFQRMLEKDGCFFPDIALKLSNAYWQAFFNTMYVEPSTRKTLILLVRKYKLGILTDLTADIQFEKITKNRLWPFFEAVVTSEEVGIEKYDTKGLKLLLKKLKLKPSQVVFVGDNPVNDGLAARTLNIPYIRIMRKDMAKIKHGAKAFKKIRKISEIPKILEGI